MPSALGRRSCALAVTPARQGPEKDLEYTAEELRASIGYTAAEMKGGGFSCKVLHPAGMPAGYTLREGGFAWKELVIFLKATHTDELTDAGFEGLDAKDMLFKQYRPD